MADQSWHTQHQSGSAVLDMNIDDMEIIDDGHSDASDYDTSFQGERFSRKRADEGKGEKTFVDDISQKMGENVTQMMWQAGTQGARKAWSVYGNIDILRPYFDVEPKEVQRRLLYSLIPLRPTDERQQVSKELYGPTMVVLTLIALLLYQMKTAEHKVEEGTLMGSAFGVCFMYWLGVSSIVWFVAYVCNVRVAILQILSMMGYGLFGHCVVLFLGTVIHTSHDHMFFYFLWATVGGLSTLRMACIIISRTRGKTERLIVIGTIATFHLLFLLYLHFAYHTIVEEFSDALRDSIVPLPVAENDNQQINNAVAENNMVSQSQEVQPLPGVVHTITEALKDLLPPVLKDQELVNTTINATQKLQDSLAVVLPDTKTESQLLTRLRNSETIVA